MRGASFLIDGRRGGRDARPGFPCRGVADPEEGRNEGSGVAALVPVDGGVPRETARRPAQGRGPRPGDLSPGLREPGAETYRGSRSGLGLEDRAQPSDRPPPTPGALPRDRRVSDGASRWKGDPRREGGAEIQGRGPGDTEIPGGRAPRVLSSPPSPASPRGDAGPPRGSEDVRDRAAPRTRGGYGPHAALPGEAHAAQGDPGSPGGRR